jgi:DNA-binding LacI/PurR family transcriptional regulator
MGKITHRVSLRDVAAAAGVHVSTASLALRDDPRLKQETKEKVAQAARELGYQANPLVSAWLQQVRNPQAARPGAGLAFLLGLSASERVRAEPYYRTFVEGARDEARALGYVVNETVFGRDDDRHLLKTLARLRYCGVRGVLVFDPALCLSPAVAAELEKGFAVVVMLRCGGTDKFHRIASDTGANVTLALRELRARGCSRVAFPFCVKETGPLRQEAIAAYLLDQQMIPAKDRIPLPSSMIEFSSEPFWKFIDKHRPDAVLGVNLQILEFLKKSRRGRGSSPLYAHLGVDCLPQIPGVVNRGIEMGRAAVFKLASLVNSNRCFVPEIPALTLVPGFWREAQSGSWPKRTPAAEQVSETLGL